MVLCDNCGHDNKETAKFCRSCGAEIEIVKRVSTPKFSIRSKLGKKSRQQELEEYEKKYLNEPEGKKTTPTEVPKYGERTKMRKGVAIGGAFLLAFGVLMVVFGAETGFAAMCWGNSMHSLYGDSLVRCTGDTMNMFFGWAVFWVGLVPTIFGIRYVAKA